MFECLGNLFPIRATKTIKVTTKTLIWMAIHLHVIPLINPFSWSFPQVIDMIQKLLEDPFDPRKGKKEIVFESSLFCL